RLPMFTWSMFVASAVFLLAAPVLIGGLIVLFADHHLGAHVLDSRRGGDPLVWRTLFAFFAYPAMWATVFPALGAVCEIVPVFAKAPWLNRKTVIFALATAGTLAFVGFGSELAGDPAVPQTLFSVTSLLILGPVGGLLQLAAVAGVGRAFIPLLIVGAKGMHRRATTYSSDSWAPANLVSTIGAYLLVAGIALFVLNVVVSIVLQRGNVATNVP